MPFDGNEAKKLVFPYRLAGIDGPWRPTLLFLPVAMLILTVAALRLHPMEIFAWLSAGLAAWTLLEYWLHRFGHAVHHAGRRRGWGEWTEGMHWIHHETPEDPGHFTTRPWAVTFLGGLFYLLCWALTRDWRAALVIEAGTLLGYLGYEWVHFRAHFSPARNRLTRYWKQYHLRHHFGPEGGLYGVTTPIWDWATARRHGKG